MKNKWGVMARARNICIQEAEAGASRNIGPRLAWGTDRVLSNNKTKQKKTQYAQHVHTPTPVLGF